MGLGSTAKKIQKVADRAEQLYRRVEELREQLAAMRSTVEDTSDRVESLEAEAEAQRALVEAVAEDRGIDVDAVLAEVEESEADESADDAPTE